MRTPPVPTPFDDVQAITGRRARLPVALVYSRSHTATAVQLYGLIDVMSGKEWGPYESGLTWTAARLGGLSESCVSKAIGALSRPHTGKSDLDPDMPVFLQSRQRGHGRTATRRTIPGIPPIDVPEWTLGDEAHDPVVSAPLWRLYAILLNKRMPGLGTVALKTAELARLARVRPATVPEMVRSLEDALLVVKLERPGQATVLLPVTVRITEARRDELLARLAEVCGVAIEACGQSAESCGQPGDIGADACGEAAEPPASMGNAPPASTYEAPPASACEAIRRDPVYEDPIYEVPVVVRAAPPERAPDEKRRGVVAERSPSAAGGSVTSIGFAVDWCGRCPSPSRRVETNPDTGHPTGRPCPRCGSKPSARRARAA